MFANLSRTCLPVCVAKGKGLLRFRVNPHAAFGSVAKIWALCFHDLLPGKAVCVHTKRRSLRRL